MKVLAGFIILTGIMLMTMVLAGSVSMYIDTVSGITSLLVLIALAINAKSYGAGLIEHLKRAFNPNTVSNEDAQSSAQFFSDANNLIIQTLVVVMLVATTMMMASGEAKMLGPLLAWIMLSTMYLGLVAAAITIPAKFRLLNKSINPSENNHLNINSLVSTVLVFVAMIAAPLLADIHMMIDGMSIVIIISSVVAAWCFFAALKSNLFIQYLSAMVVTISFVTVLAGTIAILSQLDDPRALNPAYHVALLPGVYALMLTLPLSFFNGSKSKTIDSTAPIVMANSSATFSKHFVILNMLIVVLSYAVLYFTFK